MKKLIKIIAAFGMLSLFASCQMNPADDGNQNDNPASGNTTEYTVSFNLNFPDDTDEFIRRKFQDKNATWEKSELEDGTIIYDINASGILQRYSFTEI